MIINEVIKLVFTKLLLSYRVRNCHSRIKKISSCPSIRLEGMQGYGGTALLILNLGTIRRSVVCLTLRPL